MACRSLRIWIDLANSPNALFFQPIVRALRLRGHSVRVTARRFAQTVELARMLGLPATPIGRGYESGRSRLLHQACFLWRSLQLRRFARSETFDVAASHGSHTQARVAAMLGIPTCVALDYEHIRLTAYRRAACVLVPAVVPATPFERAGIAASAIRRYPGLKEDVYLHGFRPPGDVRAQLGVPDTAVLITFRPLSDTAHYLRGVRTGLADRLVAELVQRGGVLVLVAPRTGLQGSRYMSWARASGRLRVLTDVVDGPALIAASDMVVSGGGTMVREAAVLGVPAVSCFPGPLGAVDLALARAGQLLLVREAADLARVRPVRQPAPPTREGGDGALRVIVEAIVETAAA